MMQIILLSVLSLFFYLYLKKISAKRIALSSVARLNFEKEYEELLKKNSSLKEDNVKLEQSVQETIALYDITKEVCNTLEEDIIYTSLKERINKFIRVDDVRFVKHEAELVKDKGPNFFPLTIHKKIIGYLSVSGLRLEDQDKFHILGQQFLLGIKRAFFYQRVQELTITDTLTDTFNRRYFLERLNEELKRSSNFNYHFSLLMCDIDHFKYFNDHYGHLVGDALLKEVSGVFKGAIRQVDFIGRYGGEELAVVFVETDEQQALLAAERIRQTVESRKIRIYDEELKITTSIGIASFPDGGSDAQTLIEQADSALYLAKEKGRNKVCVYQKEGKR